MITHQTITETLLDLLPKNAVLTVEDNKTEYLARFDWPITTDPDRPHKRSKMVKINIHENAIRDLLEVGNKVEAKTLIDLETYFKNQLSQFEPNHNTPKGKFEPIEKWEVASLHFLGSQKPLDGVVRRMY